MGIICKRDMQNYLVCINMQNYFFKILIFPVGSVYPKELGSLSDSVLAHK